MSSEQRRRVNTNDSREASVSVPARPLLKIGLALGLEKIDFRVEGAFHLEDLNGTILHKSKGSELRWRARSLQSTQAQFRTSVLVDSFHEQKAALKLKNALKSQGFESWVRCIGVPLHFENGVKHNACRYRVLVGKFENAEAAKPVQNLLNNDFRPRLVREKVEEPTGLVEYMDADLKEHREVRDGIRLVPKNENGLVTLFSLQTVKGELEDFLQDRSFSGIIEFRIDNGGMLSVLTEVHIDTYLKGVLPAELEADFPLEAQKAQAVASRSNVLCMLGLKHMNDPFDFCAFSHCQCYSGRTSEDPRSSQAVSETAGEVMVWKDQVCDGVTTNCCGGHGESKENIWNTPAEDVLTGQLDMSDSSRRRHSPQLRDEQDFRKWILDPHKTFCNLQQTGIRSLDNRSRRYFRWNEELNRQELEEIIRRKTGTDIGTLFEIVPIQRGRSGRLMEVELIGSRRNLRLQKELKICEALSPTALFSSAFLVENDLDDRGVPLSFRFSGAGRGHGVGMCQLGAAGMALREKAYLDILKHYYPGISVKQFYALS